LVQGRMGCPVCASQARASPLSLAAMTRLPSGLKATLFTQAVCPWRGRTSCPVCASHTFTVLSKEPLSRRLPSGPNATQFTTCVPLEGKVFLPRLRVPHLHLPRNILPLLRIQHSTGAGETLAVGAEADAAKFAVREKNGARDRAFRPETAHEEV